MAHFVSFCLLLLVLVSSAGCLPIGVSGAATPQAMHAPIPAKVEAAARSTRCLLRWESYDPETTIAEVGRYLEDQGYVVREGNPSGYLTTLRKKVWVPRGFGEKSSKDRAAHLSHEAVHVCQRQHEGDAAFEAASLNSLGRFAHEVPAYRQTLRTRKRQGATQAELHADVDRRVGQLLNDYWLHDLDPKAYARIAREVWEGEVDAGESKTQRPETQGQEGR